MSVLRSCIKKVLNSVRFACAPLRYLYLGRGIPVHLNMGMDEARFILSSIHPDANGSCLCDNDIVAEYDVHIVVPIYNVELYLKECLDSIFSQQTQYTFFVSLVDDGSTDDSGAILDAYVETLRGTGYEFRVEGIHQKNKGLSAARNRALECIRGKYVMFVDSDDYLLQGAVDTLVSAAVRSDADIAEGFFQSGHSHGCACGKVYRSELFRHVHFPVGYWFEDTLNIFFLYPVSRKIVTVPGVHYYYRWNPNSIMNSLSGSPKVIDSLWVSHRVLMDYLSCGHRITEQVFRDFLQDVYSTVSHFRMLRDTRAMQALFVIERGLFMDVLKDSAAKISGRLPIHLRLMAKALEKDDYRMFLTLPGMLHG